MSGLSPQIYRPHPRQELVMLCPCNEILYGGAAGAGKSFAIVFSWMQHEATYGQNAKGLVLRKTNAELEDLINEFKRVFGTLPSPPRWNETKRTFTSASGAVLEMGYLDEDADKYRYHGRQYSFVAWDELTLWPTPDAYEFILTRARSAHGVPITILGTTNPIGPGASWVAKRWKIQEYPDGMRPFNRYIDLKNNRILETAPNLDKLGDRELPEGIKRWTRIFIPGRLADNPSLDLTGDYRAQLIMKTPKMRAALLDGRWDQIEGAFFEEWDPRIHVIQSFQPPKEWRRWMAGDWGTAKPYCFLWACEAPNGEVYVYDELYGDGGDADKGTNETASQVGQKLRERERMRGDFVLERFIDSNCFHKDGHEITIAQMFAKEGIHFQPATKAKKAGGINMLREYLKVVNGNSRIKVMSCASNLIRTIPLMQYDRRPSADPNVFDTRLEDHAIDALLYLLRKNMDVRQEVNSRISNLNQANIARYSSGMGVW